MNFMGIEDFHPIVIEGVDAFPDRAHDIRKVARHQAMEFAKDF
jgi:FMN-dependent NADH-azoreductase